MKGYRTYQICVIALILIAIAAMSYLGIDIKSITGTSNDLADLFESGAQLYMAYLAAHKVLKPHPMRHENVQNPKG